MTAKSRGRKPDYEFHGLNKTTNERGRLGAAWKNDDGSITVVLETFVQISGSKGFVYTLFLPLPPKDAKAKS